MDSLSIFSSLCAHLLKVERENDKNEQKRKFLVVERFFYVRNFYEVEKEHFEIRLNVGKKKKLGH
jgi:hypothetical protein